jgi:hypothetical protein
MTPTTPPPLEWQPLWDAMDAEPTEWIETTGNMYQMMLGCVPPLAHRRGAFLVGEMLRYDEKGHAVYACFWARADGRVFARNFTVAEFMREFA